MLRSGLYFLLTLALTIALFPPSLKAQTASCAYDFAPVTSLVQSAVSSVPLNGASLLLMKDGQVIYEQRFGAYNDNTTVFIASASKWLAGATLMTLVDEGKLSLDDPVSKHLPYFTGQKGAMTLRQMFSHTAGFAPENALGGSAEAPCINDRNTTLDACARQIAESTLIAAPSAQFAYGSNSMQAAGRVCEVVSGKSWEQLFQERIAVPLDMTGTTFGAGGNPLVPGGARGRLRDYANFLQMILNEGIFNGKRVLSVAAVREMQKDQTFGVPIFYSPHTRYGNGNFRYGIGNWLDVVPNQANGTQISSQGGFGFSPWIDKQRNLLGVFMAQNQLQNVYTTVAQIQQKVREIVDACPLTGVQINSGYGSGSYEAGKTIHIYADPNPTGKVFDRWIGATATLDDPLAAHTTLKIGATPINITATYKNAPTWTTSSETVSGVNVVHHIPQPHKGIIFRFHGSGGSAAGQFNSVEDNTFNGDAIAAGYGIVALDSVDRVNRQWNATGTLDNPDLKNVQAVINSFTSRGLMSANDPLFALGVSNGGAFCSRLAVLLQFKAGAISIAAGITGFIEASNIPFIWNMAQNDDNEGVGTEGNARSRRNYESLFARGIAAQHLVNPPSPVYPLRFWRIPGLLPADSQAIYASLKNGGFLDANDFLLQNPRTSNALSVIPAQYASARGAISEQLDVCYARHSFYSDYSNKIISFFNARLPSTTSSASVQAASYSNQALAPDSIAAVFGTGLALTTTAALTTPLPVEISSTTVKIRDSASVERFAPLFFVSPTQINYLLPPGLANGSATVTVTNANGLLSVGAIQLATVAPGLFSADASGKGLAAAYVLRVKADNSQSTEAVARFDATQNKFVAVPIDLSQPNERVFLILFGTGLRNHSGLSNVSVTVGGVEARVDYAGAQGSFVGLDQLNVLLPASLAGRGQVDVRLTVEGKTANLVNLIFR
jgi:uncharacterized protein (TIGR03437 family)